MSKNAIITVSDVLPKLDENQLNFIKYYNYNDFIDNPHNAVDSSTVGGILLQVLMSDGLQGTDIDRLSGEILNVSKKVIDKWTAVYLIMQALGHFPIPRSNGFEYDKHYPNIMSKQERRYSYELTEDEFVAMDKVIRRGVATAIRTGSIDTVCNLVLLDQITTVSEAINILLDHKWIAIEVIHLTRDHIRDNIYSGNITIRNTGNLIANALGYRDTQHMESLIVGGNVYNGFYKEVKK